MMGRQQGRVWNSRDDGGAPRISKQQDGRQGNREMREITVKVRGQQSVRRHQQERAKRGWSCVGRGSNG